MSDPDTVRLRHMLDAAHPAIDFVRDMPLDAFSADLKTSLAVTHLIEIIGEASKNVSTAPQSRYPDVPWNKLARTRDRMTHGYFTVDLKIVWEIVRDHLPPLVASLELILASRP